MLGMFVFILITTLAASSMVVIHETNRKREREDELLFVGAQYRRAILSYYNTVPPGGARSLPPTLEALVLDARFPMPVAHLRRLYPDPITGKVDWEVERVAGGIVGLRSRSSERALKVGGFPPGLESLEGKERYAEWVFAVRLQ